MPSRRRLRRQEIRMVDIAVVGAGIAESSALAGLSVVMVDVRQEALDLGRNTIEKDLDRRVRKGRLSEEERRASIGRVSATTSLESCSDSPVVIEAVVEDMAVKTRVFGDLEGVVARLPQRSIRVGRGDWGPQHRRNARLLEGGKRRRLPRRARP
jgi:hypothetical protein